MSGFSAGGSYLTSLDDRTFDPFFLPSWSMSSNFPLPPYFIVEFARVVVVRTPHSFCDFGFSFGPDRGSVAFWLAASCLFTLDPQ